MAGERILIVDDDARNVGFLRDSLLVPSGYTALSATDGEEALHVALTQDPDLILLDLQMPKMDGFEVLEALRGQGRAIPTILITAHGSESVAVQAFRLGVRDYFQKPFKVTDFMQAVDRSLIEARLRRDKEQLTAEVESVNRQLEQRLTELNTLYGISKSVASLLDEDQLLTRVLEATSYVTGADESSLFLLDEQTQDVRLRASQRGGETQAQEVMGKADEAVIREVLATGQAITTQSPGPSAPEPRRLTLSVPLRIHERVIGALCAHRNEPSRPFVDHDRYLLSALADYAAIAIENASLYESAQRELAQRKQAEETIRQMAYHDTLTGLPNRTLFSDRLGVALARARRHEQRVAVMLLDLDRFKEVNDTFGHAVGDQLLIAVGERLVRVLRESDTVCRMGGDEFLLLLPEMHKPDDATTAAERILDAFREPFVLDRRSLRVTTSIGFTIYPDDAEHEDTLVKKADIAMYRAKDKGRDNYQRYTEDRTNDAACAP